jgi:GTP cyclohydrolase I
METMTPLAHVPKEKPHVPKNVEDAIRTLIAWAGDDPGREGLLDTPKRVFSPSTCRTLILASKRFVNWCCSEAP